MPISQTDSAHVRESEAHDLGVAVKTVADWATIPENVGQALDLIRAHFANFVRTSGVDDITGVQTVLAGLRMVEQSTPSNPPTNELVIFAEASGSNILLKARSSTGAECTICTLADTAHVNTLTLNWIE